MPRLNSQQLHDWYQKFAAELYEKVQIDVTRKEDLGRIKNYKIVEWDADDPTYPLTQATYAYMSHNGVGYTDPEPEIGDFNKYARWMMKNLNPTVTDDQIQQLYDQSCEGTLMVFRPGVGKGEMQQVYTDAEGNLRITPPASTFLDRNNELSPDYPEVAPEPDPADFGRPEMPVAPKNMSPSWLSRLGHYLGFHTAYTDLLDYQKAVETYPARMKAWQQDPNGLAAFQQAAEARATYLEEFAAFQANPYSKLSCIDIGVRGRTMFEADILRHDMAERDFLKDQHANTPHGRAQKETAAIDQQLSYARNTELALYHIVGHDPHPEQMTQWIHNKVFKPDSFQPKAYELPADPDSNSWTEEELRADEERWSELAAVAGFAAMADHTISGNPPRPGFTAAETTSLNFSMLLTNLFTQGRPNSKHELLSVPAARDKAQSVLYAYKEGVARPLGELLARGLRQTMREAAGLHTLNSDHTMGTLYLISKLMDVLNREPLLRSASGLKPEELQEAQGSAELYKVLTAGAQARKDLLEHALGNKTLSPEALEQAGKDALFANYIIRNVSHEYDTQSALLQNSPQQKQIEADIEASAKYTRLNNEAAKLEKEGKNLLAANKREEAARLEQLHASARYRMILQELERPGYTTNQNLLDKNWVSAVKDALAEQSGLSNILNGSSKDIIDAFHSNSELEKITKDPALEPKPRQEEKALGLQEPEIEAAPVGLGSM